MTKSGNERNDGTREPSGRSGGGESGGGAYPNPHSDKEPTQGGYMGHGGQTDIEYDGPQGPGDEPGEHNPNATTARSDD